MNDQTKPKSSVKKSATAARDPEKRGSGWTAASITGHAASASRASSQRPGARTPKRPKQRKTGWLQIVQWSFLSAALIGWGYFLLTNPRFTIRQTNIDGIQTVNVSTIAVAAKVPPHSNIFLFLMEHRIAFCNRIKACDPAIQRVTVAVDFPSALRLHIYERQPDAVLQLENGSDYLIDSNRIAYRKVAVNQQELPIITVPSSDEAIVEGKQLPADIDARVAAGMHLLSLIAVGQFTNLSDLSGVTVDQYGNVNLKLHNQLMIKFGQPDGLSDRLAQAEAAFVSDPSLTTTSLYIDFTTNRPAVMPKPAPSTSN